MLCGAVGQYHRHLQHIVDIIGSQPGASAPAALIGAGPAEGHVLPLRHLSSSTTRRAAADRRDDAARRRGGAAFRRRAQGGAAVAFEFRQLRRGIGAERCARRWTLLRERAPALEVEGEMHGDAALSEEIRQRIFPNSRLKGAANLLIMPNLDAANIAFNLLKALGDGLAIGPILLGHDAPGAYRDAVGHRARPRQHDRRRGLRRAGQHDILRYRADWLFTGRN